MSDMLDYSEQQTIITSSSNQDIKRLRSLHERKYRKQTGWFLAEGLRICTEALQQGFAPQRLLYEDGRQTDPLIADLIIACKKAGGRVLPVTRSLLVKVSNKLAHHRRVIHNHWRWCRDTGHTVCGPWL